MQAIVETLFRSIYIYGSAICWANGFQIIEQKEAGDFLLAT